MSLRLSLLTASMLAAQAAQAAPAPVHSPDGEARLEELVVYASPLRARSDEVAQPVEILSGEALARQLGANLGETVARLPGIQTSYFGPAVGRPVIRGLADSRVKILQDGVGALDASSTSGDHAVAVEPFLADQIEILKGPATVLYGSGAIGGVVNTVTGRLPEQAGEDGYALRGEVRGGDVADERTALLRFDGTRGPWQVHLDGVLRDTNDFEIPGATESAAMIAEEAAEAAEAGEVFDLGELERGTLPNSSLDTEALSGSVNWIGDRVQVGVSLERFQTEYGLPGGHAHHHEEAHHDEGEAHAEGEEHGEEEEGGVRINLDQTRVDFHLAVSQPFAGVEQLRLRVADVDYRHVEIEPTGEVGTRFENDGLEARLELLNAPLLGFSGAFGVHLEDKAFSAEGAEAFVIPVDREAAALFAYQARALGAGNLELGARLEQVDYDPSVGQSRDFDLFALSAGYAQPLSERWSLAVQGDIAERAPELEALYSNGAHLATQTFELGNDGLKEERAHNLSVTVDGTFEALELRGSVYVTDFDAFLYLQDLGTVEDGLPARQWSQGDARFTGAEGEAVFHLLENEGLSVDLRLTGDVVRARLDKAEANGNRELPRIPAARLGGALEFATVRWGGELSAQRYFDQDDAPTFALPAEGFWMVNAYLARHFERGEQHGEVFLRGRNLLNEEARLATSFLKDLAPLPGRGFELGLRFAL
ncbi:MAG: TonB-dependent receptor [Pseudomonadales bacterium]|nr:TonB-dependent receptor [Pseudomonadales bacterium]